MFMRDFEEKMLKAAGLFDRFKSDPVGEAQKAVKGFDWQQPAEGGCQHYMGEGQGSQGNPWCEIPATHIVRYPPNLGGGSFDKPVCPQHHLEEVRLQEEGRDRYSQNPRQFFQIGDEIPEPLPRVPHPTQP